MASGRKRTPRGRRDDSTRLPDEDINLPDDEFSGDDTLADGVRITIEADQDRPVPVTIEGPTDPDRFRPIPVTGDLDVTLQRSGVGPTSDQALWVAIRDRTNALRFEHYARFIRDVFCEPPEGEDLPRTVRRSVRDLRRRNLAAERLHHGVDAYQLLKTATEIFLILNCGVITDRRTNERRGSIFIERYDPDQEEGRLGRRLDVDAVSTKLETYLQDGLPYIRRVLGGLTQEEVERLDGSLPFCDTLVSGNPFDPCLLELIWSYWHEEGMVVQAINTIGLRFQNKRPSDRNPLTQFELSPLRGLSNLLWGYIQDEPFRLTVARRSYEYSHHYGLTLVGKAVPTMRPADNRSKFLEAFHSLLRQVAIFYKADADTTVIADGFPILNGLQEVHMLLAEGAHNQFRDLPWTSRVEMLIQEWLLSRQEMKDFLRGRAMVPYKEPWMGQVDTLRRLLGWGDTPVTHFRDLGVYGEQILLSIRYGDWVDVNDQDQAKNWARYWRPEIQGYIHAYRSATGVDLGTTEMTQPKVDSTLPSVHLQRRLSQGAR
jgi:hypothetical protein